MKLFSGASNKSLAEKIAGELGSGLADLEIVRFADGEARVRIEESLQQAQGEDEVVFIQSTSSPPDEHFVETLFFIDAARRLGAKDITLAMPYFGYARQDKEHRKGEAVSAAVVARCLEAIGATKLVTLDIHSKHVLTFFDKVTTVHKSFLPDLVLCIVDDFQLDIDKLGIFSPDQDGAFRAKEVISELKFGSYGFVQKERDLDKLHTLRAVHGQRHIGEPEGKDIILIDDMIASGETIVEATRILREEGADQIFTAAVHPVFVNRAEEKLAELELKGVYVANTIELSGDKVLKNMKIISTAPTLASMIQ